MPVDQELSGRSENGNVPVLYARVMESPVAAIEFGYPVRFGVAWTEVPECRTRIATSATVLVPDLMSPRPFLRLRASEVIRDLLEQLQNREIETGYLAGLSLITLPTPGALHSTYRLTNLPPGLSAAPPRGVRTPWRDAI